MSDSPDVLGSPTSPTIIHDGTKSVEADLSVVVERRIWNLIQILSNCVGDLSKEKQITNKKMDDHCKALKECLGDIETDLTAQLKIMEESLMSTDFNCCRALYDHEVETMDEMYSGMKKFLGDAIQRKDVRGIDEEEEEEEEDYYAGEEREEIDPADFPQPILLMDPRHIGKSILRNDEDPLKNEDEIFRVRFDKAVRKRLFKAPPEEYEYPEIYRISEKLAFHKALKARNIEMDDLWESEGLLRAEGFALLAGADNNILDDEADIEEEEEIQDEQFMDAEEEDAAAEEEERPISPKTDDTRELEKLIEKLKSEYQASKKRYEELKEMLDKSEEGAPDPEYVELLKVEIKKQKIMLKTAMERRNELRNWTEEDLKQRRKEKLARKLLEAHKKPRRIEAEKPKDYMSSSSSSSAGSNGPGSVQSNTSFLNSDSSELSPVSLDSNKSSDEEEQQQDSGEGIESHESGDERDFSMPEDESSSLLQPPSSSTPKESGNEEEEEGGEDIEMSEI
uniref:Uncharacterized protein n=1 Tax=Panagrolaimus superbus TaxID=310955 RepID=A0A914Y9T3_9BILA